MLTKTLHQAYKILFFQLTMLLLLAVVVMFFKNLQAGFSVLLGGLAYIIPSIFFATKFFSSKRNRGPSKIFIDFYCGELAKLILSCLLLLLLFNATHGNIIYILIGYGVASLSLLFLPFVF